MKVKEIALQVIAALPEDAGFRDLEEFLYERSMVEHGREDFEAGRIRSQEEVARHVEAGASGGPSQVAWSEHATTELLEALHTSHAGSVAESSALAAAVKEAVETLVATPGGGVSLPEMGDPSIREVPVRTPRIGYRLLYDVRAGAVRILWFTSNVTCYRNVRS